MHNFSKILFSDEKAPEQEPDQEEEEKEGIEVHELLKGSGAWGPDDVQFYGKRSRALTLIGPINEASSLVLISQLFELVSLAPAEPINIHINTPGGNLSDGLAIYDVIQTLPTPIACTAMGQCSSAGLLVLAAANARLSFPNTMFYYHQIQNYSVLTGSQEQADSNYEMYLQSLERYSECVRTGCGINKRNWNKHFKDVTSKYMYADEALKVGLIDRVVEPMELREVNGE